jgi:hypothetical protein
MRVLYLPAVIFGATLATAACVSASGAGNTNEYLDETTAATVNVVSRPLVFARERPELAVHVRDYVTLAATAINRGGKVDCFIFVYFWSTLDSRVQKPIASAGDHFEIAADDRRIDPGLEGHTARDAGIGSPVHTPPGRQWALNVYRADPATLRSIAEARHLAVITGSSEENPIVFEVWDDQREALRALVRHLSGD